MLPGGDGRQVWLLGERRAGVELGAEESDDALARADRRLGVDADDVQVDVAVGRSGVEFPGADIESHRSQRGRITVTHGNLRSSIAMYNPMVLATHKLSPHRVSIS